MGLLEKIYYVVKSILDKLEKMTNQQLAPNIFVKELDENRTYCIRIVAYLLEMSITELENSGLDMKYKSKRSYLGKDIIEFRAKQKQLAESKELAQTTQSAPPKDNKQTNKGAKEVNNKDKKLKGTKSEKKKMEELKLLNSKS